MKKIIIILIVVFVLTLFVNTNIITNSFNLLILNGYFIPKESSIFTFEVILDNNGSGEWWLYSEDGKNYYSLENDNGKDYIYFSKNDLKDCIGFIITDYKTWCD